MSSIFFAIMPKTRNGPDMAKAQSRIHVIREAAELALDKMLISDDFEIVEMVAMSIDEFEALTKDLQ